MPAQLPSCAEGVEFSRRTAHHQREFIVGVDDGPGDEPATLLVHVDKLGEFTPRHLVRPVAHDQLVRLTAAVKQVATVQSAPPSELLLRGNRAKQPGVSAGERSSSTVSTRPAGDRSQSPETGPAHGCGDHCAWPRFGTATGWRTVLPQAVGPRRRRLRRLPRPLPGRRTQHQRRRNQTPPRSADQRLAPLDPSV